MFVNFGAILAALGPDAAFRIANGTRPPGDYLFNSILPERNKTSYHIESGSMTIRATMAGLVGMDSPYPPGGMVNVSTFLENTAKIANEIGLTEAMLRQIQEFMVSLAIGGQPTNDAAQQTVLNFLDKVVIQPHVDVMEWLRGQALVFGTIDWTFNKKNLLVDYGYDASHILPTRTTGGGATAYGSANSVFWSDVRALRRLVKGTPRIIAHPETIDVIRDNDVNSLVTVAEDANGIRLQKIVGANKAASLDAGDSVTLIPYGLEGEVLDPTDTSTTILLPFMTRGKLLCVGTGARTGFRVGEGSTDDAETGAELGYTHIGPTVEGGGRSGRWSNLFTPEHEPYTIRGRAVTNGLPVIENVERVAVATTEMPA